MDERKSIGLIFTYNEDWIGGSYYILNLIKTLNYLEDTKKPKIFVITSVNADIGIINTINYPYLNFIFVNYNQGNVVKLFINKIFIKYFNSYYFDFRKEVYKKVSIIYPFNEVFHNIKKKINWIPDFQDWYLPEMFSESEIKFRQKRLDVISKNEKYIIFSSLAALKDFNFLYPYSRINKYIFNFTSKLTCNVQDESYILDHFKLQNQKYFYCPNQFWKHKNHLIILTAIKLIRDRNLLNFKIVLSGKTSDRRNPLYFEELNDYVKLNKLDDDVLFLGFVERDNQYILMKHSIAVIQPSLFEGWSTVVEEAKSLNKKLIVSDISVHKEQLGDHAFYFNPRDEYSLIAQINIVLNSEGGEFGYNYENNILNSANQFLSILEMVDND